MHPVHLGRFYHGAGDIPVIGLKQNALAGDAKIFQVSPCRVDTDAGVPGEFGVLKKFSGTQCGKSLKFAEGLEVKPDMAYVKSYKELLVWRKADELVAVDFI